MCVYVCKESPIINYKNVVVMLQERVGKLRCGECSGEVYRKKQMEMCHGIMSLKSSQEQISM